MRFWRCLPLLLILFADPVRSHGGVYNPGESEEGAIYPHFINSPIQRNFREVILTLRTISDKMPATDNPVRRRYIFQDDVISRSPTSALKTTADRLEASAVLIRRRKFNEAELLLRQFATAAAEQDNIPLQSNFATALHLSGKIQDAYYTLRPVIEKHWTKNWDELPEPRRRFLEGIGWDEESYKRLRDCDTYYLKLLKLRKEEQREKKVMKGPIQPPDALFDVRFISENGAFDAGKIAAAERAKLPINASDIVRQLLVWMPDDLRLLWLLGELYNVQGDDGSKERDAGIRDARQIFHDLSSGKIEPESDDVKSQLKVRLQALNAAVEVLQMRENEQILSGLNKQAKADTDGFVVDWRTVGLSFATGFVLALFGTWQVREIQRRRQARAGTGGDRSPGK